MDENTDAQQDLEHFPNVDTLRLVKSAKQMYYMKEALIL